MKIAAAAIITFSPDISRPFLIATLYDDNTRKIAVILKEMHLFPTNRQTNRIMGKVCLDPLEDRGRKSHRKVR